jgi:hypothetical protein
MKLLAASFQPLAKSIYRKGHEGRKGGAKFVDRSSAQ